MGSKQNRKTPAYTPEHRVSPRIRKNVSVETTKLEYPLGNIDSIKSRMINLSRTGGFFSSKDAYSPKTLLQMSITLPGWVKYHPGFFRVYEDSIGRPFTVVSEVVRCETAENGYHIATRFVNIDPDDLEGFINYLETELEKYP